MSTVRFLQFYIVKENKGNEGTCVGISKWPVRDYSHRTTTDMWLYRAYRYTPTPTTPTHLHLPTLPTPPHTTRVQDSRVVNWCVDNCSGNIYHGGEKPTGYPAFTQGDYITCILNMETRSLAFGKNGEVGCTAQL